jgi:hypothetical protein
LGATTTIIGRTKREVSYRQTTINTPLRFMTYLPADSTAPPSSVV